MRILPTQNQFQKWKGNFKPCWSVLDIQKENADDFLFELFKNYQKKNSVFLYSGKTGRYSILAKNPFLTFEYKNQKSYLNNKEEKNNPIEILRKVFTKYNSPKIKELPPFYGGAIGLFGYETFTLFEDIPKARINDLQTPDIHLNFYNQIIVFDHLKSKVFLVGCGKEYEKTKGKVEEMLNEIKTPLRGLGGVMSQGMLINSPTSRQKDIAQESNNKNYKVQVRDVEPASKKVRRDAINRISTDEQFTSNFSQLAYHQAIERVKKYLAVGDTFQVNISQRLEGDLKLPPAKIFKIMMEINPSPFSVYFNGGDYQIVSGSPERLIRLRDKELFTQPIAGTRKRGKTEKEDHDLAKKLKNSEKEMAEHTMLVDLLRNDLGKVSEYGSVETKSFAHIEKYSHVQHLVSNIYGKIEEKKDFFDVLKAVFPGGTITGAPKIRTMEIISELEPTQRGPYTGSIGYIGFNGNYDLNILIRTIVCANSKMYIQVGGGIVMDSVPEREYRETLHKAKAMLEAVG